METHYIKPLIHGKVEKKKTTLLVLNIATTKISCITLFHFSTQKIYIYNFIWHKTLSYKLVYLLIYLVR